MAGLFPDQWQSARIPFVVMAWGVVVNGTGFRFLSSRHSPSAGYNPIPHAAESETFSRNANGVRAIYVLPAFSPTPLALGLNVKGLIHGRARYKSVPFTLRVT